MSTRVYARPDRQDEITEFLVGLWHGDITVMVGGYHVLIIAMWCDKPLIIGCHPYFVVVDDD